jgi:DNA-binding transcriptional regulator YiaG
VGSSANLALMTVTDISGAIAEQMRRSARHLPPPATCRALRESAGLSTEQLARILGVTRQAVSNWETGNRVPRGPQLAAYLEALTAMREAV